MPNPLATARQNRVITIKTDIVAEETLSSSATMIVMSMLNVNITSHAHHMNGQ